MLQLRAAEMAEVRRRHVLRLCWLCPSGAAVLVGCRLQQPHGRRCWGTWLWRRWLGRGRALGARRRRSRFGRLWQIFCYGYGGLLNLISSCTRHHRSRSRRSRRRRRQTSLRNFVLRHLCNKLLAHQHKHVHTCSHAALGRDEAKVLLTVLVVHLEALRRSNRSRLTAFDLSWDYCLVLV